MDMKHLLSTIDQLQSKEILNEGKEADYKPSYRVGKTGDFSDKPHMKRGTPIAGKIGKYGKTSDELGDPDQDPDEDTPSSSEKRGRGRPKKAGSAADTKDRYSGAKDLQSIMIGKAPKTLPGKKGKVHKSPQDKEVTESRSLKDWFERLDEALNEAGLSPTQTLVPGMQTGGQKAQPTIIDVKNNPALKAGLDKAAKDKQLTVVGVAQPTSGMTSGTSTTGMSTSAAGTKIAEKIEPPIKTNPAEKGKYDGKSIAELKKALSSVKDRMASMKEQGKKVPHDLRGHFSELTFAIRAKQKGAGHWGDIKEADPPPDGGTVSPLTLEGKKHRVAEEKTVTRDNRAEKAGKKVTKDIEYDEKVKDKIHGKKREPEDQKAERAGRKVTKDIEYDEKKLPTLAHVKKMLKDKMTVAQILKMHPKCDSTALKKMVSDCKKKMVKEGRDQHLHAAYHEGKSHGLSKQPYSCRHDDMEEARMYHEGYKCGLDECYGQQPVVGYVGEETDSDIVDTMASYGAEGLEEALDPVKKARLNDLIELYRDASDPGGYGDYDDDPNEVIDMIRQEFGNKIADQVSSGSHKMHFGRHKIQRSDPLGWKKPVDRITKAGKMYKQDSDYLKNTIKSRYRLGGKSATEGVEEGLSEMDKSAPQPGRDGRVSHSTYGSRDKEGSDYFKGKEAPTKAITAKQIAKDALDILKKQGVAEGDMEEGNAFTGMLAKTPKGGKFSLGGKTFTDRSDIDEMAFESLDRQLNALLNEGVSVSISQGQQGAPNSVNVNATDAEADKLLAFVKQAGLGIFGGDGESASSSMPADKVMDNSKEDEAEIAVVDDHDDMLSLIRKMTGQGPAKSSDDYEDEESHGEHEGACSTCHSDPCECEEQIDEVQSEDQMTYEVAEDAAEQNAANVQAGAEAEAAADKSEEAETSADEHTEAEEDMAIGASHGGNGKTYGGDEEEELEESYANAADDDFEADINFMTKVISGGLNKQKSTGQTTIPVIAGQTDRMGYSTTNESITDWKKLAGLR